MNLTTLLRKLIEIEQSIGVETNAAVRRKMQDVQDDILKMQKEQVANHPKEHTAA